MDISWRSINAPCLLLLAACGGGGSSSVPPANQAVGGIYQTQFTVASGANTGDVIDAFALISETGQYFEYGKNTTNAARLSDLAISRLPARV